jgi:hypothetical protein
MTVLLCGCFLVVVVVVVVVDVVQGAANCTVPVTGGTW